jgi:predicted PurR-regulated permease PerM
MFLNRENKKLKKEKLDMEKLNDVISISRIILKIFNVLLIIIGLYIITKLFKELHIKENIIDILKIISPLFIGFFLAWLFDPFVSWMQRKGIRRTIGAALVYIVFLSIIGIILGSLIPVLIEQINDFVKIIPDVFDNIKLWINSTFNKFDNIKNLDIDTVKQNIFNNLEQFGSDLTSNLPDMIIIFIKGLFSGVGNFVVGLIIGFFLLINFNNASDSVVTLFPKKFQNSIRDIFNEINTSFRRFINGALLDCTLIFVLSSICFVIAGLRAPLLFGLFCGLTNIIPYAGPYIGGIPAVIVGFSQGTSVGVITLISIVVIQFLEGNFLQPLIMSKSTKLHPVTVIIGLLIFGHFFGIIGMAISTPIIGALKAIFLFFDEKYGILNYDK